MRSNKLMLVGGCLLILFTVSFDTNADNVLEAGAPAAWTTPGTEWVVRVRQDKRAWGLGYSDPRMRERAEKPQLAFESHVRITVLEPQGEGEQRIARIQFTALDDAPAYAQGAVVLEIDATNGAPKAVKGVAEKKYGIPSVAEFNDERVLFSETSGFPLCWIVSVADLARIPPREEERTIAIETKSSLGPTGQFLRLLKNLRPSITSGNQVPAVEVEAALFYPFIDEAQFRVVQTWVPGEGWWRSFKRYTQGHIDLEAELVESIKK